jgi:3'-phosphoadenosine 5'-phosphosulfate sulfotransferase (PAPS reductase)/FAD synthetase
VALFSGGNDSTVLLDLFRDRITHAAHVNTGIGIEETRQFVRDTAAAYGVPLIEESPPPGSTYRELVLSHGFPGPAHHFKMYQRLKERPLHAIRSRFVTDPRSERVVFLAGRRRHESARRAAVPEHERTGSIIWASPLVLWTKADINTYRAMRGTVPENPVSALLHMSGECLCGAFARPGERAMLADWFPEVWGQICELEEDAEAVGLPRCQWGWGAGAADPSEGWAAPGVLCSGCYAQPTLPGLPQ